MADKMPWGLKSDKIAPGSLKAIPESKLKSFNIGAMNIKKGTTKREQEEYKKKRENEETEQVFKEFVESFEDTGKSANKAWVKGGIASDKGSHKRPDSSKLYKPSSKLAELASTFSSVKAEEGKPVKKIQEKKKTNLELFKEELQRIQEERQERRKIKQELGLVEEPGRKSRFDPVEPVATGVSMGLTKTSSAEEVRPGGAYSYGDELQTTNLYLGNINPKMTETQLCEVFGKYGPLASVKIMWPRSDEERARGRNCGFVAFMNRKDGERALAALQGKDIMTFEMKLGWGKAVPIPPHPVYIPPALAELSLPPPPSGLPFNAQPRHEDPNSYSSLPLVDSDASQDSSSSENTEAMDKILANAVVKVVIPTERSLLCLIHRMVEFVVREGPMFEAMVMSREISNAQFRFLFENRSPAHIYYRWKLYSILQGDDPYKWRTEEFRMFNGGSLWRPPRLNPYTQGMPDELVVAGDDSDKKGQLSESQRDRLEDLLRELNPERSRIADAMVWCLDHAESAEEVVECISESLAILQTPMHKKIARLFLVSDILHNSSAKVPNASFFRKYFERRLPDVFRDLHDAYENIDARLKAESFKQKVMLCFRAWEDWAIYPNELLIRLQNVFLGLASTDEKEAEEVDLDGAPISDFDLEVEQRLEDLDGNPLPEDDLDGIPVSNEIFDEEPVEKNEDVDGAPLEAESSTTEAAASKFIPSKWESVDESLLEAQAVTTSKWDMLEEEGQGPGGEDLDGQPLDEVSPLVADYQEDGEPMADSLDGSPISQDLASGSSTPLMGGGLVPYGRDDSDSRDSRIRDRENRQEMSEERRAKLRDIEVKVMKYQDEVEAGKRSRKPEITLHEQVELYRRKLLSKEDEKERERKRDRRRGENRERGREVERGRDRDKDRDVIEGRERSRSGRHNDRRDRSERRGRDHSSSSEDELATSGYYKQQQQQQQQQQQHLTPQQYDSPVNPRIMYRNERSGSPSTPLGYRDDTPRSRRRSRSPRDSRSNSPRRAKRSRTRSRSPTRHRHKHKKNRH